MPGTGGRGGSEEGTSLAPTGPLGVCVLVGTGDAV